LTFVFKTVALVNREINFSVLGHNLPIEIFCQEKIMRNENLTASGLILALILGLGTACSYFKKSSAEDKKIETNTASSTMNGAPATPEASKKEEKKGIVSPEDKADFNFTAEDLYKEFKADKNPLKGEKYVDKIIAVSGRIKNFDLEKKTADGYSVMLSVGQMFAWVECRVDEENKDEFANLKKDQQVTLKGLGDKYWLAGPRLKHCVIVEGN
jgi:hypothetical protein